MTARLAAILAGLMILAGCSTAPALVAPEAAAPAPAAPATTASPQMPAPSAPAAATEPVAEIEATPVPATLREPVTTLLPEIRIDLTEPVDPEAVRAVLDVEGVTFATAVSVDRLTFTLPDGRSARMRVASIDPEGFRILAPQISADDPELWARILEGHAAVTHEAAEILTVGLRDVLTGPGGPLAVGAIAANGQPAVADALVDRETAGRLGLSEPHSLLVSVLPEAWPDEVAEDLAAVLDVEPTLIYGKPQRTVEGLPDDTVWDALAMCESSGRWHLDSGNGYYGGLQFLPSSWHLVGGTGLPHEASRDEQIHRAELLLARQGWKAWPACTLRLGLREPDAEEG